MNKGDELKNYIYELKSYIIGFIIIVGFLLLVLSIMSEEAKTKQKCASFCSPKSYYFSTGNFFDDDVCECDSWRAENEQKIVVVENE